MFAETMFGNVEYRSAGDGARGKRAELREPVTTR
jgi:hypothetical protein